VRDLAREGGAKCEGIGQVRRVKTRGVTRLKVSCGGACSSTWGAPLQCAPMSYTHRLTAIPTLSIVSDKIGAPAQANDRKERNG